MMINIMRDFDPGSEAGENLRILFTCNNIPSHLDSLLPIITATERAGHTVAVAAPEELGEKIAGSSLEHVVAGREWITNASRLGNVAPLWMARVAQPFYLAHMAGKPAVDCARDIIAADWEPDAIVREPMEFGAVLAAEALDVPSACIGTASFVPEAFPPSRMSKIFASSRRSMGLPKDPEGVSAYPFYASLMPRQFDPRIERIPNAHFYHDNNLVARSEQTAEWLSELPEDRPLIYACLGSAALAYGGMLKHATRMMEIVVDTLSEMDDYTAIVSTGDSVAPEHFGELPEHVKVMTYVPQRQILARAELFVTHAGYKSFMESVVAGTPMVTVPLIGDSMYTARCGTEKGVSRNISRKQLTVPGVLEACIDVLTDPSYKQSVEELRSKMLMLPNLDTVVEDLRGLIIQYRNQKRY